MDVDDMWDDDEDMAQFCAPAGPDRPRAPDTPTAEESRALLLQWEDGEDVSQHRTTRHLRAALDREAALTAERDAARAEVERLRYVLDGVAAAIDTGRNEPLTIWREQIRIAQEAAQ